MGIYVNPGNTAFKEAINSMIYLDKSESISYINTILSTQQKYIYVSRPRRFVKSMAASILTTYYLNIIKKKIHKCIIKKYIK